MSNEGSSCLFHYCHEVVGRARKEEIPLYIEQLLRWEGVITMQGPDAYEIIGNKIKVKYNSLQWNQHEKDLDIFEDINRVDAYCGDDVICWLDTFNWSVMNKTKLTEDVYQFISHRAGLVRRSIDNEVELAKVNGVNWEVLEPVQYAIKKGAMNIIDFIF